MLSQKLFRWINKVALFAIVFASLAPSISHALAATNNSSFAQEICTADGTKITIQVLVSKGKQLATELSAQSTQNKSDQDKANQDKSPAGIQHHLQHCPFCVNPGTDVGIQAQHAPIIAILAAQAQHIAAKSQVVITRFSALPPPAQAPPAL